MKIASLTMDISSTFPLSAKLSLSLMSVILISVRPIGSEQRGPLSMAQLKPAIIDSLSDSGIDIEELTMSILFRVS